MCDGDDEEEGGYFGRVCRLENKKIMTILHQLIVCSPITADDNFY